MFSSREEIPNRLPKSYPDTLRCFFRISGGMGDVLICSGVASNLRCIVDLAVPPHLVGLVKKIAGIRNVFPLPHYPHGKYDVVSNFDGIFATFDRLVDADYYKVAANKINAPIGLAKIRLEKTKRKSFDFVIHPSSSNPNRAWAKEKWFDLAISLAEADYSVAFLGTKKEPGFTKGNIFKLSDVSNDLIWQTRILNNAGHFVGNDSGFAHLAGLLNVQGNVLFFNTKPENVISHYPTLNPICGFLNSSECTGNLNPLDKKSKELQDNISCELVCKELGVPYVKSKVNRKLPDLSIIGKEDKVSFFSDHLEDFNIVPGSEIVLNVDTNKVSIKDKVYDFLGGPYDLLRFLISKGAG